MAPRKAPKEKGSKASALRVYAQAITSDANAQICTRTERTVMERFVSNKSARPESVCLPVLNHREAAIKTRYYVQVGMRILESERSPKCSE